MSGRSGYRKTDRKRRRRATSPPRSTYVLRFVLPPALSFSTAQGIHGAGVTVGFNNVVFAQGKSPRHCAELASAFLFKLNICNLHFAWIPATLAKLLPCAVLTKAALDLEAIHDNCQRNAGPAKTCRFCAGVDSLLFYGILSQDLVIQMPGT